MMLTLRCTFTSCIVFSDADWKGPLCHLSGCETLLTWWTVRQRQRRVHYNSRQTPGPTGQSKELHILPIMLAGLFWWDCVHRMTTASYRGSFWGSISSLLVWQLLMSPPACQSMECLRSLCHGHLSAQSALFQLPVKMEQLNRKYRAAPPFHFITNPKCCRFVSYIYPVKALLPVQ